MEIKAPSPEEYGALATKQAHRFPEKYSVTLPGDRGSSVRIPVVLGNPSGACRMPLGEKPDPAWSNFVAAIFRVREESTDLVRQAAADCLLWPDRAAWSKIVERWPGAPDTLWDAARAKCGASLSIHEIPAESEDPPAPVREELSKLERAVWRKLSPPGHKIVIVVDAPQSTRWQFFSDAMKKPGADRWALVCEMVQVAVPAAFRVVPATMDSAESYEPIGFVDDCLKRWPGFAVHVAATLSQLSGLGARVDRDEW